MKKMLSFGLFFVLSSSALNAMDLQSSSGEEGSGSEVDVAHQPGIASQGWGGDSDADARQKDPRRRRRSADREVAEQGKTLNELSARGTRRGRRALSPVAEHQPRLQRTGGLFDTVPVIEGTGSPDASTQPLFEGVANPAGIRGDVEAAQLTRPSAVKEIKVLVETLVDAINAGEFDNDEVAQLLNNLVAAEEKFQDLSEEDRAALASCSEKLKELSAEQEASGSDADDEDDCDELDKKLEKQAPVAKLKCGSRAVLGARNLCAGLCGHVRSVVASARVQKAAMVAVVGTMLARLVQHDPFVAGLLQR